MMHCTRWATFIRITGIFAYLASLTLLLSCDVKVNSEAPPPPTEAIEEIRVHGITLSPDAAPYPSVSGASRAVNPQYIEGGAGIEPYVSV